MVKLTNTIEINGKTYFTGAIPTPRNILIKAKPFIAPETAVKQENHLHRPKKLSYWLNGTDGDCVSAEEAFARGCGDDGVFITDESVGKFIDNYALRNGARIDTVIEGFSEKIDGSDSFGFIQDGTEYYHGGYGVFGVDWTNENDLKQVLLFSPVKLGVAASQIQFFDVSGGWIVRNVQDDPSAREDHCVSLCGFGTFSWLAEQLEIELPDDIDGSQQGWAIFTWNSIGIVDTQSLLAMTFEAWARIPINKTDKLYPSKDYPEWDGQKDYKKGDRVWWLNFVWESVYDGINPLSPGPQKDFYWTKIESTAPQS